MKTITLASVLVVILSISFHAHAIGKPDPCVESIEVFSGEPDRAYQIIAPVQAKSGTGIIWKRSPDQLYKKIKKQACQKQADAVINLECYETVAGRGYVDNGKGKSKVESIPICSGMAVRWK